MVKILHRNVLLKSFILLGLFLATGYGAEAQRTMSDRASHRMGRKVRFGFKLDPGVSFMRPQEEGAERTGGRFYFSYGVLADFYLDDNSNYAFGTGLQISHMGSVIKYQPGVGLEQFRNNPTEYDLRLQYVEVPFTLKLKADTRNGIGVWGQFGGFTGFPVRGRANVISALQRHDKQNVLRDINPLNIGLLVGGGIEYPITETLTGVAGINFQNGFIDVTRNGKWNDGRVNMSALIFRFGVYF